MSHPIVARLRDVEDRLERQKLVVERLVVALHPLPQEEYNGKQARKFFKRHKVLKKQLLKLIQ